MILEFDVQVKLAIYNHFAETGCRPIGAEVAEWINSDVGGVLQSYQRLRAQRLLILESDEMRGIFAGLGLEGDF